MPRPGEPPADAPGIADAGGVLRSAEERRALRRVTARAVTRLGTPIILANLLTWLVGFSDVLMVSRLGEAALAGLGMANQVFFLVVILILAVTTGTMALVARAVGANDPEGAAHVFRQSMLLAVAQSVVIGAVGILVAPGLLRLLGATPPVVEQGSLYLRILLLGAAAPVLDFTLASTFRGAGDAITPLQATAAAAALNILGNWLLIFGPGPFPELGVAGAAIATVLARSVAALWCWSRLRRGVGRLRLPAGSWRPDGATMRRILRIGVPSAFEGFLRAGSGVAFLGIIARTTAGPAAVAAHTVGLQLESFARMPAFAISVGATALVGQHLGAGDPEGAERVGWISVGLGAVLLAALGMLLFLVAGPVAAQFSTDAETVRLAVDYLRILALAQPVFLVAVVLAGALRGGGDSSFPMWVSFLSGWVFLLPVAWFLSVRLGLGPEAAWLAQALNYLISAVLVSVRFRRGRWRTIAV